ncbi:MAG: hypothetical protein IJ311_02440, partial [Elusimicrobiaceae bacterium]|nr:hypothetical protein [Elusimicrobiaceae bacterium]
MSIGNLHKKFHPKKWGENCPWAADLGILCHEVSQIVQDIDFGGVNRFAHVPAVSYLGIVIEKNRSF